MSTDAGRKFFDEFIDDYFAECEEHLNSARRLILELEKPQPAAKPRNVLLDELLRDFHSVKGLSAMVGMEDVTQLAHHIEDYFRTLQDPAAEISPLGISQVLAAVNTIDQVLSARRQSEGPPDVSAMLLLLTSAAEEARPKPRKRARSAKVSDGDRAASPTERKWKFEFKPSAELAANGVTVSTVRDRLARLGQVASASPRVLEDGGVAFEFTLVTSEPESSFKTLLDEGLIYAESVEPAEKSGENLASAAPAAAIAATSIVRVDMARLDDLMRIVGELVISRFHLDETLLTADHGLTKASLRTLQAINSLMERQVRELRETVIRTRMVPIGQIFERMRFVVRGLERENQKKVRVEIEGQDVELDKIIVERMMDPLLHLVRNSATHGIEMSDRRLALGKPAEGTIHLSATTAGDTVIVEVEDDGRGIDIEKVTERARSIGMLGRVESLDSKRMLDVICAPGFTTRDTADLGSGRGVGMAAVQSTVTELGGLLSLQTNEGKGTRFTIQLPLTLAIADSLLFTVEGHRYAVPQASVREVLAVDSSSITAFENNEVTPYRGGVLPILRLTRMFGMKSKPRKRIHVLVIGSEPNAIGVAVDRITGQREIVVRAITDPMLRIPGISGATELGDGRPVLILDVHALIRTQRGRVAVETRS